MRLLTRSLLVFSLCWPLMAGAQDVASTPKNTKPEVIINPSGLEPDVLEALQKGVGAVVRQADDQDGSEAARIRRKGHEAAVSALQTKGYFEATVTLEVGEDIGGETWEIMVEPGAIAKVKSVSNEFTGRITQPDFAKRVEQLRQSWGLPIEQDFINARWSSAKSKLLDEVQSHDFYLARLLHSQALVNPETASVETKTVIDSGPAVTLGPIQVIGLRRVPVSLINHYIKYQEGDRFSQAQLDEWQQQLQSTNFFRGVFVKLDTPKGESVFQQDQAQLPVSVRVTEGPARQVTGSLGFDDSVGLRAEGVYRQNVVNGWPITLETGVGADFKRQRAYLDFYLPPNDDGSVDSFGLMARHSDIQNEKVLRSGIGWRRKHEFTLDSTSRVEYESNWALLGTYDHIRRRDYLTNPDYKLPAVVATYDILRRDVNDKYDPRSGNLIALGLGYGRNLKQKSNFSRASVRGQLWFPVGKRDVVTVRAELAKVWAKDQTLFPDDFGYRTGGARTIRGYKYYGIGEKIGDSVIGTRALAVGSVEYMHYFNDIFGMGVFVDAGDAASSFKGMRVHMGYGVGALIKTPAGPLNLDIAYGQKDRKIRLHFSLGIAF